MHRAEGRPRQTEYASWNPKFPPCLGCLRMLLYHDSQEPEAYFAVFSSVVREDAGSYDNNCTVSSRPGQDTDFAATPIVSDNYVFSGDR
ncbi:unnamed protein product [Fusarium graminearum]|nr:unnamed protein product [Fusarium graminearum]VTO94323.1 unnamed protein product [Fusarium graminearum]